MRSSAGGNAGIVNMLAARPSMGKTATTITSAAAASRAGFPVHVFGLEDSWQAVADRWLSRESQIPAVQLRQGLVDRAQVAALFDAGNRLRSRVNVLMDGRAALSATEIVRTVRRFCRSTKPKLVIVDYVQLVRRRAGLSENEALDEIATMFSDAAKADDVAYLVTSQLNRECEKRDDKRPQLSDLRGSGALEERAKVAVGQYRGVYYYDRPRRGIDYDCECPSSVTGGCVHAPSTDRFASTVQLIVLKNSNGPTGPVFARWNGPTMESGDGVLPEPLLHARCALRIGFRTAESRRVARRRDRARVSRGRVRDLAQRPPDVDRDPKSRACRAPCTRSAAPMRTRTPSVTETSVNARCGSGAPGAPWTLPRPLAVRSHVAAEPRTHSSLHRR
jgi:hypothetical protein